jgi:phage FluMu protein Com
VIKLEPRCPRCDTLILDYDAEKNVCARCKDVLEFGYPAFEAYPLEDSDDLEQPQRMDMSEGWVLPDYITAHTR